LALLEVTDLKVHFVTDDGIVQAVDGVSYSVDRGQALGIVGESGSGKSVSSLTVMGLTRFAGNARISGSIRFDGKDLLGASDEDMRKLRGNDIAMIFQDPLSSLHPFYKIGDQLVEAVQAHREVSKAQALDRAVEMLGLVGIPEPRRRVDSYPHEFSGGMRQRVMIAMALINDPKLLIADEPTTALDVTVQAQILDLIQRLQRELDTAIVMITHDLGVVAEVADDIGVMYAGRIVEYADNDTIFAMPEHPYTWGLLKSIPRLDSPRGEELVPIPGRPPSLILKPPGCSFHPRCPYVREAHKRIDPQLAPAAEAGNGGGSKHEVACLLPGQTRRGLWAALRAGGTPDEALSRVDVPDEAVDREAVGEVLAPEGTEVVPGVEGTLTGAEAEAEAAAGAAPAPESEEATS
jgi:peptide/nickel transport system ATP-binding protein